MQKGSKIFYDIGNARALEYFKKCGLISEGNRHIDYRSPIVQKYKYILGNEVDAELSGNQQTTKDTKKTDKKVEDFFNEAENPTK